MFNFTKADLLPSNQIMDNADIILKNLEKDMVKVRTNFADWHIVKESIKLSHTTEEKFSDDKLLPVAVTFGDREGVVYFNVHSFSQFGKMLDLPANLVDKLIEDNNIPLLVDNIKHYLKYSRRDEFLFRLKSIDKDKNIYEARAVLPKNYNRLDNIYLLSGIKKACCKYTLQLKNYSFDGDNMEINLVSSQRHILLKEVGDEVVSGIYIQNSEIGETGYTQSLVANVYFERLICTNGMTTKGEKKLKIKTINHFETHYYNTLPPIPLQKDLQEKIDEFIVNELIGQLMKITEQKLSHLQKEMERLSNIQIPELEKRFEEIVRNLIKISGLFPLGQYSIEEIRKAYDIEKGIYQGGVATALILYHAITRYASNIRFGGAENNPQQARFGRRITRQTHRLSDDSLDWIRVMRKRNPVDTKIITPPTV